jgi:hypothetical protein
MFVAACTLKRVIRDAAGRIAANIVKPPGRWPVSRNKSSVCKGFLYILDQVVSQRQVKAA